MDILELLTVFGLGALELLLAVPSGLALGIDPLLNAIVSATGALTGALVVVFLGERVRAWRAKKKGTEGHQVKPKKRNQMLIKIWDRYGVAGLGLFIPVLTGVPLGTALGLGLGASAKRLIFWVSMGIILWTIILTVLGVLGVEGIKALVGIL